MMMMMMMMKSPESELALPFCEKTPWFSLTFYVK